MAAPTDQKYLTNSQSKFVFCEHNARLESVRRTEFERLNDAIYLDHTGATLYSKSQIEAYSRDLLTHVYGNPHSLNPSSQLTTDLVDQVRFRILQHFNTTPGDYSVIFTAGATASLKLLAETFDFDATSSNGDDKTKSASHEKAENLQSSEKNICEDVTSGTKASVPPGSQISNESQQHSRLNNFNRSADCDRCTSNENQNFEKPCQRNSKGCLVYLQDSHTSVVGMREVALTRGAAVICLTEEEVETAFKLCPGDVKNEGNHNLIGNHENNSTANNLRTFHGQNENLEMTIKRKVTESYKEGTESGLNDGATVKSVITSTNICDKKSNVVIPVCLNTDQTENIDQVQATVLIANSDITNVKHCSLNVGQNMLAKVMHDSQGHNMLSKVKGSSQGRNMSNSGNGLFVYPPQSNFSGQKYPLEWTSCAKQSLMGLESCDNWYVALDAATFVSTNSLDLSTVEADFVAVSFYKMFGFPTGLGALIVKNSSSHLMKKTYFGGGTVQVNLPKDGFHVPRQDLAEKFEDGTIAFLDILALKHGFDSLLEIGGPMSVISNHTFSLARHVYHQLKSIKHPNGAPVAELYTGLDFTDISKQGNIVNFSIMKSDGSYVGFSQVDRLAQLHNIHLRTGCFCNMGACQKFLNLTDENILDNFKAGHVCGDGLDLVNGRPTGSVRISFGYMSTLSDANAFLQFIRDCFVEKAAVITDFVQSRQKGDEKTVQNTLQPTEVILSHHPEENGTVVMHHLVDKSSAWIDEDTTYTDQLKQQYPNQFCRRNNKTGESVLAGICVYPVKSCGSLKANHWELSSTGLMYDRGWMIVNQHGTCLSQKREPKLCLIKPYLDLTEMILVLTMDGEANLYVPLNQTGRTIEGQLCQTRVCGDKISGIDCGPVASDWLSTVLGRPGCRLIQQHHGEDRQSKLKQDTDGAKSCLSFTNESQFLLVNMASCQRLLSMMHNGNDLNEDDDGLWNLIDRFRANLVIYSPGPFEEDTWSEITIGRHSFMSLGACNRCQMICVDQETGTRSKEPLMTLSAFKGNKVTFGIHLKQATASGQKQALAVGDQMVITA